MVYYSIAYGRIYLYRTNEINLCTAFIYSVHAAYPCHYRLISVYLFCIGIGNGVSKTIRLMFSFWYKNHLNEASQAEKKFSHTHSHTVQFVSTRSRLKIQPVVCSWCWRSRSLFNICRPKFASSICITRWLRLNRLESMKIF